MKPNSRIVFISDKEFLIDSGKLVADSYLGKFTDMPKLIRVLTVIYSSDGSIHKFEQHESCYEATRMEEESNRISLTAVVIPGFTFVAAWGLNDRNYLYRNDETQGIIGSGRARNAFGVDYCRKYAQGVFITQRIIV